MDKTSDRAKGSSHDVDQTHTHQYPTKNSNHILGLHAVCNKFGHMIVALNFDFVHMSNFSKSTFSRSLWCWRKIFQATL